jgi:hypothetical protein
VLKMESDYVSMPLLCGTQFDPPGCKTSFSIFALIFILSKAMLNSHLPSFTCHFSAESRRESVVDRWPLRLTL